MRPPDDIGRHPASPDRRDETVKRAIAAIERVPGGDISIYNQSFLLNSLENRRQAAGAASCSAYLQRLESDDGEATAFIRSLQITYSEFFRNPLIFAMLERVILPKRLCGAAEGREEFRVWSAGCAAGQEALSVAMLLEDLNAMRSAPVPYRIFATDASERELALACAGVYDVATAGNLRLGHLNRYFDRQGDKLIAARSLRTRVEFSCFDLLDENATSPPDSIYGNFDLVMCSNVLLYYRSDIQQAILRKLCRSMADDGFLATDETERQIVEGFGGLAPMTPLTSVYQPIAGAR